MCFFFKLCRWCNCNGDKCVCEMEMMVVIMMRSFWKREKWTPLGLLTKPSSLFEAALHPRWTVELLPPWKNACVFRGVLQHLRKFAFLLRVWMGRLIPLSCADMWVVSKQKQIGVFPKMLNFSLNKSAAAVAAQSLTLTQMSCCAASSRGSAGGQSRTQVPLSTDLKLWCFPPWGRLIDACHWGGKRQLLPASVWTECLICPHEHTVRCACPRQKHVFNFLSLFAYFCCKFTLCLSCLCVFADLGV